MIPFSRLPVLLLLVAVSLIALPMGTAVIKSPFEDYSIVLPIVLVVELIVYFFLSLVTNPRLSIGTLVVISVFMMVFRLIACIIGITVLGALDGGEVLSEVQTSVLGSWVGNPIAAVLQMLILVFSMPHLLDAAVPALIGPEVRTKLALGTSTAAAVPSRVTAGAADAAPAGGFIQVFSYEELAGVLRKTHGLEGFVVFNEEGLIVWRDLPMRVDMDSLVARLMGSAWKMAEAVMQGGLTRVRKVTIESREHLIFVTQLNQNFNLMLVYNNSISPSECFNKFGVIAKTAREFLQWKYPGLAVTASMQSETAVPLFQGA